MVIVINRSWRNFFFWMVIYTFNFTHIIEVNCFVEDFFHFFDVCSNLKDLSSWISIYSKIYSSFKHFKLQYMHIEINPFSANFTKWSNTLKQFIGNLPTNYLSMFDDFVFLALKGLRSFSSLLSVPKSLEQLK